MVKYLIAILITLFVLNVELSGQEGILKGNVKSKSDGVPLNGAHVVLTKLDRVAITNYRGDFNFRHLPDGAYEITVSFVGFATQSKEINILSGSIFTVNFALEEEVILADEAVITASGTQIARKDVTSTISVVSRQTLEESGESALLPVINEEVPGVFVTERGVTGFGVANGSAGHISIRGVGGNPNTGVLVMIDGSPQYMGIFGHPLPDAYVTSDAERVEVIRGPASVMYGSNAMAGAINIITRKQTRDGFAGNARLSYGSYDTRKIMGNAGYKNKGFEVFGSLNYDHTDGHRENSSFDIINGYLKVSRQMGDHIKAKLDGNIAKFKTADPGPATNPDSSYLLEEHWIDILRNMVSLSIDNSFSSTKGSVKLFYNSGMHDIYDGFRSSDHNAGFSIYQSYIPFKGNTISGGIDFKNMGGKAENTEAMMGHGIIFTDTTMNELGGYLMLRQKFMDRLTVSAGVRLQYHSVSGSEWVPHFGASFLLNNKNIIKASVSKGFRNPTIRELFMWQPANPNLKPESMWSYEAGYLTSLFREKLKLETSLYYQAGSNLIETVGQYPDVQYQNTGSFTHYGIEFSGTWYMMEYLSLQGNYSWLHMDEPISGAPVHKLFTALRYSHEKFSSKLSGMYIHDLYTNAAIDAKQSYFLLNARISYQVLRFLNVWLSGENLLNQEYEINYDYPMPGITVIGGIDMKFQSEDK